MIFYSDPTLRTIDFDIRPESAGKGGFRGHQGRHFAIRLAAVARGACERASPRFPKRTGKMVNAEGAMGEANIWGERRTGSTITARPGAKQWVLRFSTIPRIRGIRRTGTPALTACLRANIFGLHDFEREPKDGRQPDAPSRRRPAVPLSRDRSPRRPGGRAHCRAIRGIRRHEIAAQGL